MWDQWLNHPKNTDFKALFDSKPKHVQHRLKHHMFTPFEFMDTVRKGEGEWDFNAADCSVYQYASFLGSGFITCLVCFFMQVAVPLMIMFYTVRVGARFPFPEEPNASSIDFGLIWNTTWEEFCFTPRPFDALMMQYVVYLVYLIRVVPSVAEGVYNTLGDAASNPLRIPSAFSSGTRATTQLP